MEEDQKKHIEEVLGGMRCPKDSPCYSAGFELVCRSKDAKIEGYFDCLAENPRECSFSTSVSQDRLCRCPLRIYLAENLKP